MTGSLNTSTPVALAEMEQKSNVRHCVRALRPAQLTAMRTIRTFAEEASTVATGPLRPLDRTEANVRFA